MLYPEIQVCNALVLISLKTPVLYLLSYLLLEGWVFEQDIFFLKSMKDNISNPYPCTMEIVENAVFPFIIITLGILFSFRHQNISSSFETQSLKQYNLVAFHMN